MKKSLNIVGTVELDRSEITQAIKEFLTKEGLTLNKAIYKVEGTSLAAVKVDVSRKEGEQKQLLINPKKGAKLNLGIFPSLKKFFDYERSKKNKYVKFEELFKLVKAEFPYMDENKLRIYIRDQRQLPGIKYDNSKKLIEIENL